MSETPDFGLYLHWPFCAAKCPYCDFNSHVRARIDEALWKQAFLAEIRRVRVETGPRVLKSIFLGGGTPSLMSPELVDALLQASKDAWAWSNDIEITLEANPTSIEAERFAGYRDAGVNRVSLGVQALREKDLRLLGRLHSVEEALQGLQTARDTFERVSFDLIYARQYQTLDQWDAELREALSFDPDHLSLYQLTIEPETAFGKRFDAGALPGLPDEDTGADMYERTQEICEAHGLHAYEVSNHAKTGAESRHNMLYWQQQDWAGIGPGAHGRLTIDEVRYATETHLSPESWLAAVKDQGDGTSVKNTLDRQGQLGELLLLGLRVTDGISTERLARLGWDQNCRAVVSMLDDKFIEIVNDRLCATAKGRPVLNAIISQML
ncbi:radical SAM family heme chaperone HemW [Shimia ponticola]|uniref:radical SAM family heme chaperone HemW n=1 Tax=Shimia ponticola TaxID=2582893 RepID=UPI0011BDD8F8|nr:radical SAM family heme chaperone HemW [Shimia ponticola]